MQRNTVAWINMSPELKREMARVSSPPAQEVVWTAYLLARGHRSHRQDCFTEEPSRARLSLRGRLKESGLAQRLAAGDQLPDIAAAAAGVTAIYYRLARPRTLRESVLHLARHLEWYLDPQRSSDSKLWIIGLLLACMALGLLALGLFASRLRWPEYASGLMVLVLLLPIKTLAALATSTSETNEGERAYELFRYLLNEYSDREAPA